MPVPERIAASDPAGLGAFRRRRGRALGPATRRCMYPPVVNDTSSGGAAASNSLRELVEAFELLENHVRRADTRGVFDAVTTVAARQLDQADWASITVLE